MRNLSSTDPSVSSIPLIEIIIANPAAKENADVLPGKAESSSRLRFFARRGESAPTDRRKKSSEMILRFPLPCFYSRFLP
jgi:hypothetical protein